MIKNMLSDNDMTFIWKYLKKSVGKFGCSSWLGAPRPGPALWNSQGPQRHRGLARRFKTSRRLGVAV